MGVEVYTVGVDINNLNYDPFHMFDADGVIQENVKPFKYSDFRKKYSYLYNVT